MYVQYNSKCNGVCKYKYFSTYLFSLNFFHWYYLCLYFFSSFKHFRVYDKKKIRKIKLIYIKSVTFLERCANVVIERGIFSFTIWISSKKLSAIFSCVLFLLLFVVSVVVNFVKSKHLYTLMKTFYADETSWAANSFQNHLNKLHTMV